MAKGYDATDLLCFEWARTRRQLLGLDDPKTRREYIGAMGCTLGNVQRHHDGAASFTTRAQHFPEVYEGTAFQVNRAFKAMLPNMRDTMDLHFCCGRGACKRADLLGIKRSAYWARVRAAKKFVEGFLASGQDRAIPAQRQTATHPPRGDQAGPLQAPPWLADRPQQGDAAPAP